MVKGTAYFSSLKDYSLSFWILCLNMLIFVMSFNMLLPEMNAYLTDLNGADKKLMILGLWTIAAAIARPFSGKIADNISRKSVMYFGILVSVLISFSYTYFATVTGFLFLRFLHGFSTGFHPTGATALIADIIPQGKRGEAMGIFGVMISIGFSAGMAIGSPIKLAFGVDGLFLGSALMGIFSMFLLLFIQEKKTTIGSDSTVNKILNTDKLAETQPKWRKVIPRWNEILAPEVIHPTTIMFLTAMISGIYMVVVPDMSAELGMTNKGKFYLVNVLFTVVTRFAAGKLYDRFGARKNLNVGLGLMILATFLTGTAASIEQFMFSGVIYGIAAGICSPALFAWTADLSNPIFKGRGMSTMFIALELGLASGAYLTQVLYNNQPDNILALFIGAMVICGVGIIYLLGTKERKRQVSI